MEFVLDRRGWEASRAFIWILPGPVRPRALSREVCGVKAIAVDRIFSPSCILSLGRARFVVTARERVSRECSTFSTNTHLACILLCGILLILQAIKDVCVTQRGVIRRIETRQQE